LSLTGNLEDLPLLDIIQIVSFSKKTGFLTIRTGEGENAIVFRDGFVVSSFTWNSPALDPRAAGLPRDKRETLVRNRIAMALEHLIRLREGQFSFSLTSQLPEAIGPRRIAEETLEVGINAQELLLNLARGMDEDRRDSSAALEASFAQPVEETLDQELPEGEALEEPVLEEAPEDAADVAPALPVAEPQGAARPVAAAEPRPAQAEPAPLTLLVVDDELDIRRTLAELFREAGYEVVTAGDPNAAVKAAQALRDDNISFSLVTDLGMPTSGGSSFQGGFEVVKRLAKMKVFPPILMMTDSLSASLRARARQMGVSHLVFKPGLSKLDSDQYVADLRAFAGKLAEDVLPQLSRRPRSRPPGVPPATEPAPPTPDRAPPGPAAADLKALQRHLEVLRAPGDASRVSRLVMQYAREFFERGILFLIKDEEVRGLGGFGAAPKGEELGLLAREIVIPLSEPSVFQEAVVERKSFSGALPDEKWCRHLMARIGRFKSSQAALLPLLTHRQVTALLYGDNPESGRELGSLEALEVFIDQAGVALEKVFLQRKLQALQVSGATDAS
jgi:CheY-like chemotaxis protein